MGILRGRYEKLSGIILFVSNDVPPTPFDINQLHLIVALSRQRSGVNNRPVDDFRGGSFQPLTHLSAWKTGRWSLLAGKPSFAKHNCIHYETAQFPRFFPSG